MEPELLFPFESALESEYMIVCVYVRTYVSAYVCMFVSVRVCVYVRKGVRVDVFS